MLGELKIFGLTGGIGAGKSAVGRLFRAWGATVVDADVLAREAVEPGTPALQAIIRRFGDGVLTETAAGRRELDRKKFAEIVFNDKQALADLNAIVHPVVGQLLGEKLKEARDRGEAFAIYEVPLLYESGLEGWMDAVVVVAAPDDVRVERVVSRDGMSPEHARKRMAAQLPQADKIKRATFVIDNGHDTGNTEKQARTVLARLRERAGCELSAADGSALGSRDFVNDYGKC